MCHKPGMPPRIVWTLADLAASVLMLLILIMAIVGYAAAAYLVIIQVIGFYGLTGNEVWLAVAAVGLPAFVLWQIYGLKLVKRWYGRLAAIHAHFEAKKREG